ncbi:MAG: hypothetical protein KKC28_04505 [Verrucomicrobia bacterium]|nr:hypothetical protein [Verrucomicrobiota bacterium]
MKFEIRQVRNGAVLRVEANGAEGPEEITYQEREDDEIEAFADFLRVVLDHYGPTTSRYSQKRIRVLVEPGDKYESPPAQPGDCVHAPHALGTVSGNGISVLR